MSIEDRLRDAARAVDEMWTSSETTQKRLARLEARLATEPNRDHTTDPTYVCVDAERLVEVSRRALSHSAEGHETLDVMAEVGQVWALTHAIGHQLALGEVPEISTYAATLANRSYTAISRLTPRMRDFRADQLSEVRDVRRALLGLQALLGEVGIALVSIACDTEDEHLYMQCIEAIDASDDMGDEIREMLRRFEVREQRSTHTAAQSTE
ncbi:DUF6099 family protein [Streptomyces sp. NPDC058171]